MSSGSATPFPASAVPIIGQPCTVQTFFTTVLLVCNCEAKHPLLVVGYNNPAVCPACRRGFQIQGMRHDVRTGQPPHFDIHILLPKADES